VNDAPRQYKFEIGDYRADVMESKSGSQKWYVVFQKRDTHDIVAIDRYDTYELARQAVLTFLERITGPSSQ